ncbi:DEAD/DEAH box helicase [Ancylostoma caninum]|uniref:DEAD/DEAH box helicase n=1 Tax=Ancylostoma caninum TaxID=29170 RepID=A0A368H569_ANCCA|nr:DEAD/DEAH box helicase [Ancylostoma caninum]
MLSGVFGLSLIFPSRCDNGAFEFKAEISVTSTILAGNYKATNATILLVRIVDVDLHSILCLVSEKDKRSQFSKVLSNIEQFWNFIDVDVTMAFLKNIPCYNDVISALEKSWREDEEENTKKRVLLRTVPLFGYHAIYDLMCSIYDNSEKAAAFVNELCPDFPRYYQLIDKERNSPRGVVTFCPAGLSVQDVINPQAVLSKKYKFNLNYEDLPPASLDRDNVTTRLLKSIDERVHAETPILLRDYQKELCERALMGDNTIIAAPTGSGKTAVLFMTPNTIILDQQATTLRKFLNHQYEVFAARGSDNIPLREVIAAKDVLVSTPQLIVNLLKSDESDDSQDLVRTPFELTTFTMMVFDECHSAVKNSPYAVLMRSYHRLHFSKRFTPGSRLPQIIGLTASLGVGGASNEVDAASHVVGLCACLDCTVISTVRRNVQQLLEFSPIVFDEVRYCNDENDYSRLRFIETICDLMDLFEEKLYELYSMFKHIFLQCIMDRPSFLLKSS